MKGEYIAKEAAKKGCEIRNGKGSHIVMKAPDGRTMAVYHGELSKGVACKVAKWLAGLGIAVNVICFVGWLIVQAAGYR